MERTWWAIECISARGVLHSRTYCYADDDEAETNRVAVARANDHPAYKRIILTYEERHQARVFDPFGAALEDHLATSPVPYEEEEW